MTTGKAKVCFQPGAHLSHYSSHGSSPTLPGMPTFWLTPSDRCDECYMKENHKSLFSWFKILKMKKKKKEKKKKPLKYEIKAQILGPAMQLKTGLVPLTVEQALASVFGQQTPQ
jgi:hypothetical protein